MRLLVRVEIASKAFLSSMPCDAADAVRQALTRPNPDYAAALRLGFATGGIPEQIHNYRDVRDGLLIPRGAWPRIRSTLVGHGLRADVIDKTSSVSAAWPAPTITLRDYQASAVAAAAGKGDGILVLPTGTGKTIVGMELARKLGQRTLVIAPSTRLADQWWDEARSLYGVLAGKVYGGIDEEGEVLTIALCDSLVASNGTRLARMVGSYGTVIADECHGSAAMTHRRVLGAMRARHRYGLSADYRRGDCKEFLIRDEIGPVIYRMTRREAEAKCAVVNVKVRLVPTEWPFGAGVFGDRHEAERAALQDDDRLALLDWTVEQARRDECLPLVIFCGLRESVAQLGERYGCPMALGGASDFDAIRAGLGCGDVELAVATYRSFGQGIDAKAIRGIICATPLGKHQRGFLSFNQVRGRAARLFEGKTDGAVYYLWDHRLHARQAGNLDDWNDGVMEVWDERNSRWREATLSDLQGPVLW